MREGWLRGRHAVLIEKDESSVRFGQYLTLDDAIFTVEPAESSRNNLIAIFVQHPFADVDGLHGTYVVGIWKVVIVVGLLVSYHEGAVVSLLVVH